MALIYTTEYGEPLPTITFSESRCEGQLRREFRETLEMQLEDGQPATATPKAFGVLHCPVQRLTAMLQLLHAEGKLVVSLEQPRPEITQPANSDEAGLFLGDFKIELRADWYDGHEPGAGIISTRILSNIIDGQMSPLWNDANWKGGEELGVAIMAAAREHRHASGTGGAVPVVHRFPKFGTWLRMNFTSDKRMLFGDNSALGKALRVPGGNAILRTYFCQPVPVQLWPDYCLCEKITVAQHISIYVSKVLHKLVLKFVDVMNDPGTVYHNTVDAVSALKQLKPDTNTAACSKLGMARLHEAIRLAQRAANATSTDAADTGDYTWKMVAAVARSPLCHPRLKAKLKQCYKALCSGCGHAGFPIGVQRDPAHFMFLIRETGAVHTEAAEVADMLYTMAALEDAASPECSLFLESDPDVLSRWFEDPNAVDGTMGEPVDARTVMISPDHSFTAVLQSVVSDFIPALVVDADELDAVNSTMKAAAGKGDDAKYSEYFYGKDFRKAVRGLLAAGDTAGVVVSMMLTLVVFVMDYMSLRSRGCAKKAPKPVELTGDEIGSIMLTACLLKIFLGDETARHAKSGAFPHAGQSSKVPAEQASGVANDSDGEHTAAAAAQDAADDNYFRDEGGGEPSAAFDGASFGFAGGMCRGIALASTRNGQVDGSVNKVLKSIQSKGGRMVTGYAKDCGEADGRQNILCGPAGFSAQLLEDLKQHLRRWWTPQGWLPAAIDKQWVTEFLPVDGVRYAICATGFEAPASAEAIHLRTLIVSSAADSLCVVTVEKPPATLRCHLVEVDASALSAYFDGIIALDVIMLSGVQTCRRVVAATCACGIRVNSHCSLHVKAGRGSSQMLPKHVEFDPVPDVSVVGTTFSLLHFTRQANLLDSYLCSAYFVAFQASNTDKDKMESALRIDAKSIIAAIDSNYGAPWFDWLAEQAKRPKVDMIGDLHANWIRDSCVPKLTKATKVRKTLVTKLHKSWSDRNLLNAGSKHWVGKRVKARLPKDNANGTIHPGFKGVYGGIVLARAPQTDEETLGTGPAYAILYDDDSNRRHVLEKDIYEPDEVTTFDGAGSGSEPDEDEEADNVGREPEPCQKGRAGQPEMCCEVQFDDGGNLTTVAPMPVYSDDPAMIATLHAAMFSILLLLQKVAKIKASLYYASLAWLPFMAVDYGAGFSVRLFSDYDGESTVKNVKHFVLHRYNGRLRVSTLWAAGVQTIIRWHQIIFGGR